MNRRDIEKIFFPESVAVCGLSERPDNLGRRIVENLSRFAFTGRVYGIGRKAAQVDGIKVYADPADLPEVPDLGVLLVPVPGVLDILDALGRKGVRHVVMETGGFTEFGADRKEMEDEIRRIVRRWDITLMGPNCIGVMNRENGLCLPFVPMRPEDVEKGRNSFISQSGGLFHETIRRCLADHVGLSKLASIGNKLMLDGNDFLEFLIGDAGTERIGIYFEDIKDGRRLMDLASNTEKPVIVLKGNTSPVSREIASFHTAALLGDDGVVDAAFRQAGIHRIRTLQEMVECFKIFSIPPMKGDNLIVMTQSGGQAVTLADEAHIHGFNLLPLPEAVAARIRERVRAGVIRSTNPIDLGDVFDRPFLLEVMELALREDSTDCVVYFHDYAFNNKESAFEVIKGVEDLCSAYKKPVVLIQVPDKDDWFAMKYRSSFPWFSEIDRAFDALRRSVDHYRRISARRPGSYPVFREMPKAPPDGPSRIASTREAFSLMEAYEVPLVPYEIVTDRKEAAAAARRMGYPVALKAAEPFILHKTEAGAVRLGITTESELDSVFDTMKADVYLLQAMAPDGVETIIGGKRDPQFGPVVMFGLGGIFVEVMKDVTVRVAPIDEKTAHEMIGEIKGAPILSGARGKAPTDRQALAKALVNVSRLLVDHPEIRSLDINPLRVLQDGSGCLALDVKIECDGEGASPL